MTMKLSEKHPFTQIKSLIFSPYRPFLCSKRRNSSTPRATTRPEAACRAQSSTPPPQTADKSRTVTTGNKTQQCVCVHKHVYVRFSYHKRDDAPLRRLPFKAAVDVSAITEEDHDATLHPVKVLLQQLTDTKFSNVLTVNDKSVCECKSKG